MKIEVYNKYKRRGDTVSITFKVSELKNYITSDGERYNHSYIFTYIEYNKVSKGWHISTSQKHDYYVFDEIVQDLDLINCFIESDLYSRVKKAMKI